MELHAPESESGRMRAEPGPHVKLPAGMLLRRARERLGLTYRDVERASYDLASQRGRPEFVIRVSRLADIENHDVTPSLHKLYALSVIYHLDPLDVCRWYQVPLDLHFADGVSFAAPNTHLAAPPASVRLPLRVDPGFDPRRTELLSRMVESWAEFEAVSFHRGNHLLLGYIGQEDHCMEPLLRPGSLVAVDPARQRVRNSGWNNEFERPIYFVDMRTEYRCGWCSQNGPRLIIQPHPLSAYAPETRQVPEEAEVLGQVVGIVMRLASG